MVSSPAVLGWVVMRRIPAATERYVDVNGVRLRVFEAGRASLSRAGEVATGPYQEVMLDGAGHWIQQERPQDVNSALLAFLSQLNWS